MTFRNSCFGISSTSRASDMSSTRPQAGVFTASTRGIAAEAGFYDFTDERRQAALGRVSAWTTRGPRRQCGRWHRREELAVSENVAILGLGGRKALRPTPRAPGAVAADSLPETQRSLNPLVPLL